MTTSKHLNAGQLAPLDVKDAIQPGIDSRQ